MLEVGMVLSWWSWWEVMRMVWWSWEENGEEAKEYLDRREGE
jgi:hypothetical protein